MIDAIKTLEDALEATQFNLSQTKVRISQLNSQQRKLEKDLEVFRQLLEEKKKEMEK